MPVWLVLVIAYLFEGVGATERLSAVRWGVAGQVVTAWILTWPSCAFLGYWLQKTFALIY